MKLTNLFAVFIAAFIALVLVAGCGTTGQPRVVTNLHWDHANVAVYVDPELPAPYVDAVAKSVVEINRAAGFQLLAAPKAGTPIFAGRIPGAPDRDTIYVRDDGNTSPGKGHTYPFSFTDGRLYSAEVVLPLRNHVGGSPLSAESFLEAPLSADEIAVVVEHELAHAVGSEHSTEPGSVMLPHANGTHRMTAADAADIRHRYLALAIASTW